MTNGNNNKNWFEKIIRSSWFSLTCLILTLLVNGIIASLKKDWTWAAITLIVLVIILALICFLSFLMRKEREDIMQSIIQEDGLLDKYLQQKIEDFNNHGNCLIDVQKECKKRMQQNFFKTTEKVNIYDIDDILEFEKKLAPKSEIWIITDELGTDIINQDVFDTIISNLNNGTIYKYYHTKNASDTKSLMERKLKREHIIDIDKKVIFTQVGNIYDALLTITKDVIILNPDDTDRRAFICIYSNNEFKIAFYRELNEQEEIKPLCSIIREYSLTNTVATKEANAFLQLQNQLNKVLANTNFAANAQLQYIGYLNQNLDKLNEYVEGKRSGKLEKTNYYAALHIAANSISKEKRQAKENYKGEIWALSLCLLNEWNEEDEYEKKWIDKLVEMDKQGINTRRLYVFDDKTLGLKPFDDKGKKLLEQLDIYLFETTQYKHTKSHAISKSEIDISDDAEFERGFFALNLEDKRTFLIYDVSEEEKNIADKPCGEIDYDNARKKNVRNKWELYYNKAKPLNEYLIEKSNEEAIKYMETKKINLYTKNVHS